MPKTPEELIDYLKNGNTLYGRGFDYYTYDADNNRIIKYYYVDCDMIISDKREYTEDEFLLHLKKNLKDFSITK